VAAQIVARARDGGRRRLFDLVAAGGEHEVRDQIVSFLLAGLEGTALTLSWTWYLLAGHPDVEARLREHLHSTLGEQLPTVEDLPQLGYVEQVVREAMRLYPPVWGILRRARQDCAVGGLQIPRGTIVIVPQWVIHRDPRWFPEPAAFRPERWGAAAAPVPRGSYFPFGAGQRQCVGGGFAMTAAVLMLATMAGRLRLERVPGVTAGLEPFMSLRPRHGLPLLVRRRVPARPSTKSSEVPPPGS
jgi:cytochrome P450